MAPPLTSVVYSPESEAARVYGEARAHGFRAAPQLNLQDFGGRTIENLTFTNVYLGPWAHDDMKNVDTALAGAMEDAHLNNVIAQYYADGKPTSTFAPSRQLPAPSTTRVTRTTIESLVATLDRDNGLSGSDLASTVFCFMLPPGAVLADGSVDSHRGLGGYHGSIHPQHGSTTETVYYAVGVYSQGTNGIVAFDKPWKNVCATFYHELNEARTDPDVEDAIRAGSAPNANSFLGWYSPKGGEIGDIPMEEAGGNLSSVMQEVPLVRGGTAPIQLMWSNAVGAPEGPIATPHPPSNG